MNRPINLLRLMRPKQWVKNAFVFTGFLFGREYDNTHLFIQICLVAVAFCLASSATYVFNDVIDRENDLQHPKKKLRPIPLGTVSVNAAYFLSLILLCGSLILSWYISWHVFTIILLYLTLNIAYSFWLKQIVIIDVFCIAAGFMLRILAGTLGVGIIPSNWLLLCGLMITLFLGFAKRRAEIIALQNQKGEHRKVLENYGPIFLDQIISICASGVIITYSLYTMSTDTILIHKTQSLIYTVPFVIYGLFRYMFLLHHRNIGGSPTRDIFTDKHVIASVIGFAITTSYLFLR